MASEDVTLDTSVCNSENVKVDQKSPVNRLPIQTPFILTPKIVTVRNCAFCPQSVFMGRVIAYLNRNDSHKRH
jgi:hypothetical protein